MAALQAGKVVPVIETYHLLFPRKHPHLDAEKKSLDSAADHELLIVDADIRDAGAWAGVATLVEQAYRSLRELGAHEILKKHNYELHMALPQYREELPLKAGSLTDLAHGAEKTRNFSVDRAYRIVHGLIDFVIEWRKSSSQVRPYIIVVQNFSAAQHLARRFFLETARRCFIQSNLRVVIAGDGLPTTEEIEKEQLQVIGVSIPTWPSTSREQARPIESDAEAKETFKRFTALEYVELNYNRLLSYYESTGNGVGAAKAALAALCVYNHFGYYYEGNSFVETILPYFEQLVDGSQERRWNYTGNLFQSFTMRGEVGKAREVILKLSEPYLTDNLYRAKMEYILGIIDVRYEKPPRLEDSEAHLSKSIAHIDAARDEIDAEEYVFQKVFMENGLAYLRVKQGRRSEAIKLCQDGYHLLTEKLGSEVHKLHRSVLQYNTAQVYSMMGHLDAALLHYEHARAMDPNYSEYYNEMGNIYQQQQRFAEALSSYEDAIQLSPPYPEVHFNKAVCQARAGDWIAALKSCDYSLELDPNQAEAQLIRAEICAQLERSEEAIESYDAAIALNQQCLPARINKAVLLFDLGYFGAALHEMNQVILLDGTEPSHYENRAAIYRELEQWNLCEQDERQAEYYCHSVAQKYAMAED